ncbi:cyclase family protein [Coprothermobacteraceae bacterium]|nr:cyclase family protein [Coprothermobacteraceae bacterium]
MSFRVIDLSVTLGPDTPVYPGDPKVEMELWQDVEAGRVERLVMGTHAGTHVDFPLHVSPKGASADVVEPSRLVSRALFLDVSGLSASERTVAIRQMADRLLNKGLILKTHDSFGHHSAQLAETHATAIAEAGVVLLAVDALSVEDDGLLPVHRFLLSRGIYIVEGLCNLDRLRHGCEYLLFVGALKLAGAGGAPARVLAVEL